MKAQNQKDTLKHSKLQLKESYVKQINEGPTKEKSNPFLQSNQKDNDKTKKNPFTENKEEQNELKA